MSKYQTLQDAQNILSDTDYYDMIDEETGKKFRGLGNSGCQKLAAELGYTHRINDTKCIERDNYIRYECIVSILDSDGRILAQDVGACDNVEKPAGTCHNIQALSKTRAWQRAIKTAACVNERLASDLGPTERIADGPSVQECGCAVADIKEPYMAGGIHICGTCGQQLSKVKRIQFLSACR